MNVDLKMSYPTALVDKFFKLGVLKEEVAGTSFKKYPQSKEIQCMASSAGFRVNDASDIIATKRALNRSTTHASPEEKAKSEAIYERYGKALDQYPQCFGTLKGTSQAGEFSSDLFGALVLEKYFMDYPPKNEEEKVASVTLWLTGACTPQGAKKNYESSADQMSPQLISSILNSDQRFRNHPEESKRLKNIYLNLPGTAKLFDCKREEKSCFDHLSFYSRAGSAQNSAIKSKSQGGVR